MKDQSVKIITQPSNELNEDEWIDISIFMKQFTSRLKRSAEKNYYKSKLLYSPFGISYVTRALDTNGLCVGLTTLTKKLFKVENQKYDAFELGDSYVSKEYQGRGIYNQILLDALSNIKNLKISKFIFSTPNRNSMPGLLKKGFVLSNYEIFTRVLPLNYQNLLRIPFSKYLISIYLIIINAYFKIFFDNKNLNIKNIKNIDEIPDLFFSNNDIEQYRSKEYLNWRFFKNPDNYLIYTIYVGVKYIGYLVFKEVLHKDQNALYLADVYIDKKYLSFTSKAISKIILLNFKNFAFVSTWVSKKSIFWKQISYCFPINYKNIPFIIHKDLTVDDFFDKNKNIHFVIADGDNI